MEGRFISKGLSLKQTRILNISTVLSTIRVHGPVSRAEIGRITNLSPTTCTATTKLLLETGIISEVGEGDSSGGRRPIMLQINKEYGYVIGVARYATQIRCSIYNMELELVFSMRKKCDETLQQSFKAALELVQSSIEKSGIKNVLGLTISTEGIIDTSNKRIIGSPLLGVENILNLEGFFKHITDFPVYIENDSNILAFAEKKLYYPERSSLVYIVVGSGIGAGIIIDDKMVRGKYGYVGEIGHITIDRNGPLCYCGNKGCLETLASKTALNNKIKFGIEFGNQTVLQDWFKSKKQDMNTALLIKAAQMGDAFAKTIIREEADLLYMAVLNVINLYDPEVIVIGGFDEAFTNYIIKHIVNKIKSTIFKYQLKSRIIVKSSNKEDLAEIGAALNSLNMFFEQKLITNKIVS